MTRIIIRSQHGILGWFDPDKATEYQESTEWDGHNHISVNTGQMGRHQSLYRTSGGRWVLEHYSQWQGEQPRHEYISDGQARDWLILNERDDAVVEHFGEVEPERGPGRPVEVGGQPINVRLGTALPAVDAEAERTGQPRAKLIRDLLGEALTARAGNPAQDRLPGGNVPLADVDVVQIGERDAPSIGYDQADAGRIAVQIGGQWQAWALSLAHAEHIITGMTGRWVRLRRVAAYGSESRWAPEWAEED